MNEREKNIGESNYSDFPVQVWDIVKMYNLDFFEGNVLKYLLRTKNSRLEDLKKIRQYIDEMIRIESEKDSNENKIGFKITKCKR